MLGVDEESSPHRAALAGRRRPRPALPVVTADLHSALPAILAGVLRRPAGRPGGVRDDRRRRAAGLVLPHPGRPGRTCWPAWSRSARRSAATWRRPTSTADCWRPGTCWRADVGRGGAGAGQPGHRYRAGGSPGVAVGEAVNAVAALGGRPVGSLRISAADPRPRHRGVSHHSLTAYGRVALAPADLVVPDRWRPTIWPRRWSARAGRRCATAPGGAGTHRRSGRGAAGAAGEAVHDGPRPGRRPRLLPGRRGGRPARGEPGRRRPAERAAATSRARPARRRRPGLSRRPPTRRCRRAAGRAPASAPRWAPRTRRAGCARSRR